MNGGKNEGSIRKRNDGLWEARYTDGKNSLGKQIQHSVYGHTRKEVAQKLNAILHKKQTGNYVSPKKILLKDWLDLWLNTYAKPNIRQSTYISYEGYVYNHIIPILGNTSLQKITPNMIQDFYNKKFTTGRIDGKGGLSPKTLRNMHNMLHQSMNQAKANGLIAVNPTNYTMIPKVTKKDIRFLSVEEEARLVQVTSQHRLGFAILFDLVTGLRIGELCALKWSDINMNKQTVSVSRTLQRIKNDMSQRKAGYGCTSIVEGVVKTNSGFREIPISDNIFQMLLNHRKIQQQEKMTYGIAYQDFGYVFAMPLGTCVEPKVMRDVLNSLLNIAGLEHINFHNLRHTFASRAIENGVNVKTLSDILGHSGVQITMDLYCHSSLDLMRNEINKVACMI